MWLYTPLIFFAVVLFNASTEAWSPVRFFWQQSLPPLSLYTVEFDGFKSIGYHVCTTASADVIGSVTLMYSAAPTKLYRVYAMLILISHTLLMDNSFREYKVKENGTNTSDSFEATRSANEENEP